MNYFGYYTIIFAVVLKVPPNIYAAYVYYYMETVYTILKEVLLIKSINFIHLHKFQYFNFNT